MTRRPQNFIGITRKQAWRLPSLQMFTVLSRRLHRCMTHEIDTGKCISSISQWWYCFRLEYIPPNYFFVIIASIWKWFQSLLAACLKKNVTVIAPIFPQLFRLVKLGTRRHGLYTDSGLILASHQANEKCRYKVTSSRVGWTQTYNQPCDSSISL